MLEVARGNVPGMSSVNKFGRSTNVDNGIDTDIWDRANSTNDQDIWVPPTTARTHQITSTAAADDGDPAGNGARTIRVYGLTAWNTAEVSEVITMNGTSNVATANSYVIIHRMKVLTAGSAGPNSGYITATADTDGTVTAQINPGEGQTQMAIYGIPSTKTAYMTQYYASAIKSNVATVVAVTLLFNPEPDTNADTWLTKHTNGLKTDGTNALLHRFNPPNGFAGPGIFKIQGNASGNDTDVSAGFDLVLVDN